MRYHLMNVHDIKIEGHDAKEAAQPAPEAAHEAAQEPFQKRKKQCSMSDFVLQKESLDDKIAKEASKFGASFRYLTRSLLVRKGLQSEGLNQPVSISTVRNMVQRSAKKKRIEVKELIESMVQNDDRFSAVLDEWTSTGCKRYMNVCLHFVGTSINLGMEFIPGYMPATEAERLLVNKLSQFGIDFDSQIVGISSDGCSVMERLGKNILPEQQLCQAHGIQLAVNDNGRRIEDCNSGSLKPQTCPSK
jgi:hypothetical protein